MTSEPIRYKISSGYNTSSIKDGDSRQRSNARMHGSRDDDSRSISTTLLAGMKSDDSLAWQRVDQLFRDEVHHWLLKQWGIGRDSAGDLVQNVFLKVHVSIDRFDHHRSDATFRGWLWTIVKNEVMDHFGKKGREPRPVGGTVHQEAIVNFPELPPDDTQDELNAKLVRLIEVIRTEVSDSTFRVFQQTVIHERECAEVAKDLGMKPSTVREAKRRVLQRLRSEWTELFGAWPFDHRES